MSCHHNLSDDEFKWSEARIRRLIALVKANRRLWHNSVEGFTGNPAKRIKLFMEIANDIGTTAYEANRRFTSLRERFGRESKKHEFGEEAVTWPYFHDLGFLQEVIRRRDKRKTSDRHPRSIKLVKMEAMEEESTTQEETELVVYAGESAKSEESFEEKAQIEEQETMDRTVFVIEPSKEAEEDETVETAFKYFKLELKKMEQQKREYCIDKMMMAFLNAKSSYPN